jgi:hypothetical protein
MSKDIQKFIKAEILKSLPLNFQWMLFRVYARKLERELKGAL